MAALRRACNGRSPALTRLLDGQAVEDIEEAAKLVTWVEETLHDIAMRRCKNTRRESHAWAAAAAKGVGHHVTKMAESAPLVGIRTI